MSKINSDKEISKEISKKSAEVEMIAKTSCNEKDNEEIQDLKRWIASLSLSNLLDVMKFDFHSDGECGDAQIMNSNASETCDAFGDLSIGSGSHEFDLLMQMVKMQPPPPTPVHPRAIPYKPSTKLGVTDGRNEEARIRRDRFLRPRLFQLIERNMPSSFERPSTNSSGSSKHRLSSKRRQTKTQKRRFDVIAKKFVTSWGEILSVGSTEEQQQADEMLLLGTRISKNDEIMSPRCYFSLLGNSAVSDKSKTEIASTDDILDMMRLVSRGKFLSAPLRATSENRCIFPFGVPWFDSNEWFSLSVYLASRFELVLWEAFRHQRDYKLSKKTLSGSLSLNQPPPTNLPTSIEMTIKDMKDKTIYCSILKAVKKAAINDLLHYNPAVMYRDGTLHKLLLDPIHPRSKSICLHAFDSNDFSTPSTSFMLESILSISLIEIGTAKDQFRFSVQTFLKECLANAAEEQLLQTCADENNKDDVGNNSNSAKQSSKKKKKKKKKKNRKRDKKPSPVADESPVADTKDQTEEKVEEVGPKAPNESPMPLSATPPTKERNQSIMIALLVIDEVIQKTFEKLDLVGDDSSWHCINNDKQESTPRTKPEKAELFHAPEPQDSKNSSPSAKKDDHKESFDAAEPQQSNNSLPSATKDDHTKSFDAAEPQNSDNSLPSATKNDQTKSFDAAEPQKSDNSLPSATNDDQTKSFDAAEPQKSDNSLPSATNDDQKKSFDAAEPRKSDNSLPSATNDHTKSPDAAEPRKSDNSLPSATNDDNTKSFDAAESQECDNSLPLSTIEDRTSESKPVLLSLQHHHQVQCPHQHIFSFIDSGGNVQQLNGLCDHLYPPYFFDVGMSLNLSGAFEGWGGVKRLQRQKSLFAEFFKEDKEDVDEQLMASSTAASIASSRDDDDDDSEVQMIQSEEVNAQDDYFNDYENPGCIVDEDKSFRSFSPIVDQVVEEYHNHDEHRVAKNPPINVISSPSSSLSDSHPRSSPLGERSETSNIAMGLDQPSPPAAPPTPPPQLSPILVSLADLGELRKRTSSEELRRELDTTNAKNSTAPVLVAGSLPSSPVIYGCTPKTLTSSWSREDLRIQSFTDGKHQGRKCRKISCQIDESRVDQKVAKKSVLRSASSLSYDFHAGGNESKSQASQHKKAMSKPASSSSGMRIHDDDFHLGACALSESALEDPEDVRNWSDRVRNQSNHHEDNDNITATKDGATTISSALQTDMEDLSVLREERNGYRDMCLTLGAEVAKLRNMLASEIGKSFNPIVPYASAAIAPYCFRGSSYDPEFMPPFFNTIPANYARTIGPMSDAGVPRFDYDSIRSEEDGTDVMQVTLGGADSVGNHPWVNHSGTGHVRRASGTPTLVSSDQASIDQAVHAGTNGFRHLHRDPHILSSFHGLQSRLSKDIYSFLEATSAQLRKRHTGRTAAINRISKLVTALWPRAQVKIYGSHVTNLCLPSSDLDVVICLPAVHKNAPAVAPGVLEGRNAINESWQKHLARKLKGESWLDPRSIKLIERTVVPVIKVSTKDTRDRVLQLDISFDGPEHHGLEAVHLVTEVMEELPMVRPLVLVLKQFLLDRGLLTAFTGGLSSYCLFLMITRYLQEQSPLWGDCGSLLTGFLDFYGNHFDPRETGIGVRKRQYFSRQSYDQAAFSQQNQEPVWGVSHRERHVSSSPMGGGDDLGGNAYRGMKPPRAQMRPTNHHNFQPQAQPLPQQLHAHSGRPYTFDPLFVEDPLSSGNNVGRNAFRIFQIKRAFADAHRALVASLEWDINSSDLNYGSDYPLLKCLLQSEDVFYEIDEPRN